RQAIEARSEFAVQYWHNIGNVLRDQKRPAEAIAVYRQAIDAKPEKAHDWWSAIGNVLRDQKRPAEAIEAYRNAFAAYRQRIEAGSEPFNEWALDGIINSIQLAGGKPGEVADACREAIKLMPNAPLLHRRLALALRDQNKLAEANAAF